MKTQEVGDVTILELLLGNNIKNKIGYSPEKTHSTIHCAWIKVGYSMSIITLMVLILMVFWNIIQVILINYKSLYHDLVKS